MKVQVKCDRCGLTGFADEFTTDYEGRDLCAKCSKAETLAEFREEYIQTKKWLESTHLLRLKELEQKIKELEA